MLKIVGDSSGQLFQNAERGLNGHKHKTIYGYACRNL